jgi:hypothetical protein
MKGVRSRGVKSPRPGASVYCGRGGGGHHCNKSDPSSTRASARASAARPARRPRHRRFSCPTWPSATASSSP